MTPIGSSVLVIQHPNAQLSFGADLAKDFKSAKSIFSNRHLVVSLPVSDKNEDQVVDFLKHIQSVNRLTQFILICEKNCSRSGLLNITRQFSIAKILPSYTDDRFDNFVQQALHNAALKKQNQELTSLITNQNEKLKQLYHELEKRVEKRQRFLTESRLKLLTTNNRMTALHQALEAIYQSNSIGEMETRLTEALRPSLHLDLVRIFLKNQNQPHLLTQKLEESFSLHKAPLFHFNEEIGSVYFLREKGQSFARGDTDFMHRVAETISLALDRLSKIDEMENLNIQWQATFNAISEPLAIIDKNMDVLQTNLAYQQQAGLPHETLSGRKCYAVLFKRNSPCPNCKLGEKFRTTSSDEVNTIEVLSQEVSFEVDTESIYVNMYRDITEQLKMEKQIVEQAKFAELGIIGSSIAHELNNPIGGILNFAQLIKMDLKPDDPLYAEISEIELGAKRCKDIIQNLLGFTRNPEADKIEKLDLRDVLRRALKIVELQTRSKGIRVQLSLPSESVEMMGHLNLLSQAVRNILQNANDSISEKMLQNKGHEGLITVELKIFQKNYELRISDNGLGIKTENLNKIFQPLYTTKNPNFNPGLGLSIAQQIIRDHAGDVQVEGSSSEKTTFLIYFQRPDL